MNNASCVPVPVRLASIGALIVSLCAPLLAQAPPHGRTGLSDRVRVDSRLWQVPSTVPLAQAPFALDAAAATEWAAFERASGRSWTAFADPGSGRLTYAEGGGLPWMPGRGNQLTEADVGTAATEADVLALLVRQAPSFLGPLHAALGVDPATLVLNRERSGRVADPLWIVDFDVVLDGIAVEGAHVVFRINHGNLIQFGTESLPAPGTVRPRFVLTRESALAALADYVGGFDARHAFLDPGAKRLLPSSAGGLAAVWQFLFRVAGEPATWRARVDAESGEVRELYDVNVFAHATGGVYPETYAAGNETLLPLPYVDLSTGGFANGAGGYSYPGGALSSRLKGRYVSISDSCGPISLAAAGSGDLAFGASPGTDCATPGVGGAGNTHSARTQYYHVNHIKQAARGWFPSNSWLASQLRVNVNLDLTCNAFWDGFTLNFFRSGDGCGNTGEIADVGLHEFGHGLDSHDGSGFAGDLGSGETYGDITAALLTRDSCIGEGFFLDGTCGGNGDPCTQCSGVRDIDWGRHASGIPHTVANFIQPLCPPPPPSLSPYVGPCGAHALATDQPDKLRQGHCESQVSSEALWDLAMRDLPAPGSPGAWAILERLWYRSRPMARQAFLCDTSPPVWTSNGCGTDTYWRTMRAVDDDDGNLANGTPHSCHLFAAFDRHGIACPADPAANVCFSACTPPPVPVVTLTPANDIVQIAWTAVGPGVVYDLYRSPSGCAAGFVKIAEDLSTTSYLDRDVANHFTYSYQVIAHPAGNEACSARPSACASIKPIPCITPAAPTSASASTPQDNAIAVHWSPTPSGGAKFNVYRALGTCAAPGAFARAAIGVAASPHLDTQASGTLTYAYRVTATDSTGACESAPSPCAQATATGPCTAPPQFAGLSSASNAVLSTCAIDLAWPAATALCGGPVSYDVYRDVSPVFEPSPANRIAADVTGTSYTDLEALPNRQPFSYVVRARDGANNAQDGNRVVRTAAPTGPTTIATFTETFEGPGGFDHPGWEHANTVRNSGNALDWVWVPAPNGGSAWFADEDTAPSGKVLVSPRFGIGPQTILSFRHRFSLQESLPALCEDGGTLELSIDDGTTWSVLPRSAFLSGGFNGFVDESDSNPLGRKPAWCGKQMTSMSEVRVDLGGFAGAEEAKLRWSEGDDRQDAAVEPNGWYVDSVTLADTRTVEACMPLGNPNAVFADGFESGDPSRWKLSPP
jgi:hypothetical protein